MNFDEVRALIAPLSLRKCIYSTVAAVASEQHNVACLVRPDPFHHHLRLIPYPTSHLYRDPITFASLLASTNTGRYRVTEVLPKMIREIAPACTSYAKKPRPPPPFTTPTSSFSINCTTNSINPIWLLNYTGSTIYCDCLRHSSRI
jgi:hypothetical protein